MSQTDPCHQTQPYYPRHERSKSHQSRTQVSQVDLLLAAVHTYTVVFMVWNNQTRKALDASSEHHLWMVDFLHFQRIALLPILDLYLHLLLVSNGQWFVAERSHSAGLWDVLQRFWCHHTRKSVRRAGSPHQRTRHSPHPTLEENDSCQNRYVDHWNPFRPAKSHLGLHQLFRRLSILSKATQ